MRLLWSSLPRIVSPSLFACLEFIRVRSFAYSEYLHSFCPQNRDYIRCWIMNSSWSITRHMFHDLISAPVDSYEYSPNAKRVNLSLRFISYLRAHLRFDFDSSFVLRDGRTRLPGKEIETWFNKRREPYSTFERYYPLLESRFRLETKTS